MAIKSLDKSSIVRPQTTNSMLAGYSFMDYELIESVFVASNTASVTFSNLNQYATEYSHLQIRTTSRPAAGNVNIWIRLNADSANNYAWHEIYTYSGSVVTSAGATSQNHIKFNYSSSAPTTNYGAAICDILDPYSNSKNKTLRIVTGTLSDTFIALRSGLWMNTSPLSSITMVGDGQSIAAGSRFSLYGIR